jgi:cellulose synthase (UDP-forming)
MMVTAPLVYWWTGSSVLNASMSDIIYWLAPATASYLIFLGFYTRNHVMPVMTDVTQLLAAFAIVRTVAMALVKPWGHPFRVTAKGVASDRIVVQWSYFLPLILLGTMTLLGMAANLSPYTSSNGQPGYELNVVWSLLSAAMLFLSATVCIEVPKRRRTERFISDERATLTMPDGRTMNCRVHDLAVGGAHLVRAEGWDGVAPGRLQFITDGTAIPFTPVRLTSEGLAIRFDESVPSRRKMIAKLFTGSYRNEVEEISILRTLRFAATALFA